MTPTTYGRDFAYCLKSHGGVRGFYASLWRFLLRCTLFCHSVATFLTSVSSYEGGCGFEDVAFFCCANKLHELIKEKKATSSVINLFISLQIYRLDHLHLQHKHQSQCCSEKQHILHPVKPFS